MSSPSSAPSSIARWLNTLPSPAAAKRKRIPDPDDCDDIPRRSRRPPLASLRQATAAMPRNADSDSRASPSKLRRKREPSTTSPQKTPTRRSRTRESTRKEQREAQEELGQSDVLVDDGVTPRPSKKGTTVPSLPPASSDTSSARSRSRSKMAALTGLTGDANSLQVLDGGLDDVTEEHALFELRQTLEEVERFCAGAGVVTSDMKVQHEIEANRQSARDFKWAPHAYDTDDAPRRLRYGRVPALAAALKMVEDTQACKQRQESEPAWNCRVHWPILEVAKSLSTHKDTIEVSNITTARIQPKALLPAWRNDITLPSKLVDFAISLKPDDYLNASYPLLDPLTGAPSRSFNSTCHNTLVREPIAVSIETKTEDGHNDMVQIQLYTWSMALLERLRRLAAEGGKAEVPPPAVPVLSAHGSAWRIWAVSWTEGKEYVLWDIFKCASTDTMLGVYKVIATLQVLINWADTKHRDWMRSILPLKPEDRERLESARGH